MTDTPKDSIRLAKSMNKIAGQLLKLDLPIDQREIDPYKGKISLGLSLQASELAAKAMLRSLGWSKSKIRKHFNDHNLYKILKTVETDLRKSSNPRQVKHSNFLLQCLEIDGVKFGNTVGHYLNSHFGKSNSSPRNYFYSDFPTFLAPKPFNTIHVITETLIQIAEDLAST